MKQTKYLDLAQTKWAKEVREQKQTFYINMILIIILIISILLITIVLIALGRGACACQCDVTQFKQFI
jgi:hypothetical protein